MFDEISQITYIIKHKSTIHRLCIHSIWFFYEYKSNSTSIVFKFFNNNIIVTDRQNFHGSHHSYFVYQIANLKWFDKYLYKQISKICEIVHYSINKTRRTTQNIFYTNHRNATPSSNYSARFHSKQYRTNCRTAKAQSITKHKQ